MRATRCVNHDIRFEKTEVLRQRYEILETWPRNLREAMDMEDPRCGCQEDGAGGCCEWDSLDALDDELRQRAEA